jgi:homogentisate 1,2-dioxygenase
MVAEDTFRPPWFHRDVMSEFMGLISGTYDAETTGFDLGRASLHNQMSAHGPDTPTHRAAIQGELVRHRVESTMAVMFESRWVLRPTLWAKETTLLRADDDSVRQGLSKAEPAHERQVGSMQCDVVPRTRPVIGVPGGRPPSSNP